MMLIPAFRHNSATDAMALDSIYVSLMSGRAVEVPDSMERPAKYVRLQAQNALKSGTGVLRDSTGRILHDSQTLRAAGLRTGDTLTLQVRQTVLAGTKWFAGEHSPLYLDGSVDTWGDPDNGGDSSSVQK